MKLLACLILAVGTALLGIEGFRAPIEVYQQPPPTQTYVPPHPDILIVLWDDIGARTTELLTAAGRMPNLAALQAAGTTFTSGHSYPMCAPARASFYRSMWAPYNAGFGCHPYTDGTGPGPTSATLPSGISSLPKAAEGAGYSTALFGRWGVGSWQGAHDGSQDYAYTPMFWGFETWRAGIPDGSEACGGSGYSDWLRVDDGVVSMSTEYHTTAVTDAFMDWWASTPSPRFAVVCTQAAHDPFHWPPVAAMPPGWEQPGVNTNRAKYEAMVQSADYALGLMLAEVDLEETLVILMADNGDPQAVPPAGYNSQEVKFSTFEGGIRVPFVVAGLGFQGGQASAQPVSVVDVTATVSDAAGVCFNLPTNQGQSILPALDGIALPRGWIYSAHGNGHQAIVEAQWKLRELPDQTQLLYDLAADPFENAPIDPDAPGYEDVTARLRSGLSEAQS